MTAGGSIGDYRRRGSSYAQAWEILAAACDTPPSLEVFEFQLAELRKKTPSLGVVAFAEQLAETYQPVRGWFGEG